MVKAWSVLEVGSKILNNFQVLVVELQQIEYKEFCFTYVFYVIRKGYGLKINSNLFNLYGYWERNG